MIPYEEPPREMWKEQNEHLAEDYLVTKWRHLISGSSKGWGRDNRGTSRQIMKSWNMNKGMGLISDIQSGSSWYVYEIQATISARVIEDKIGRTSCNDGLVLHVSLCQWSDVTDQFSTYTIGFFIFKLCLLAVRFCFRPNLKNNLEIYGLVWFSFAYLTTWC